jgi:hypothetical protein
MHSDFWWSSGSSVWHSARISRGTRMPSHPISIGHSFVHDKAARHGIEILALLIPCIVSMLIATLQPTKCTIHCCN